MKRVREKCNDKRERESGTKKKKRLRNMRENVIDQIKEKELNRKTFRKEYDWKEIQQKERKADNSYKTLIKEEKMNGHYGR